MYKQLWLATFTGKNPVRLEGNPILMVLYTHLVAGSGVINRSRKNSSQSSVIEHSGLLIRVIRP
jgi:hypothetical protein